MKLTCSPPVAPDFIKITGDKLEDPPRGSEESFNKRRPRCSLTYSEVCSSDLVLRSFSEAGGRNSLGLIRSIPIKLIPNYLNTSLFEPFTSFSVLLRKITAISGGIFRLRKYRVECSIREKYRILIRHLRGLSRWLIFKLTTILRR